MKIELTKKELRVIMDCITVADGTLMGKTLMSPREAVRRLGDIDLYGLWIKLNTISEKGG